MRSHKHKFKMYGYSSTKIYEECKTCGEVTSRSATKEERKEIKRLWKESIEEANTIHKLWGKFCKRFFIDPPIKFKQKDWRFMKGVKDFAEKNPEVEILRCDDSYHASSDLVFIPHKSSKSFMGYTVIYIPQCTREEPISFFLYPHHVDELIKKLQKIQKEAKTFSRRKR